MGAAVTVALGLLTVGASQSLGATVAYLAGGIRVVSAHCGGQNAEVEQAVDPSLGFVYEVWIGCGGIGFARSSDGGRRFQAPMRLRGSRGGWDPAVTVAANGNVYAAFMVQTATKSYPVVLTSTDHGRSFRRMASLIPSQKNNWGDRDFLAAGPDNRVYVTWDYGPSNAKIRLHCFVVGSCAVTAGDLNVVMQTSTDGGKTFGPATRVTPGFPASGAESAPLLVEPDGRIDVLYQRFQVIDRKRDTLGRAHSYFVSSSDGGQTWTRPVRVGPSAGGMSPSTWWIDGDISADSSGGLYATWDTQDRRGDLGWLSYSTDHGATWSAPTRVSADAGRVARMVEVAGGAPGVAYVAWLTDRRPFGYAEYLRTFSIAQGWISPPRRVSRRFGNPFVWPGDTFGISTLSPTRVLLSWGSAVRSTHGNAEIFATTVAVTLGGG